MHLNHISGRHRVNLPIKETPRCCIVSLGDGKLMNNHCRSNIYSQKIQAGSKTALLHTLIDGVCGVQLLMLDINKVSECVYVFLCVFV